MLHLQKVEPTVFFIESDNGLRQGVDLTLTNGGPAVEATVIARLGAEEAQIDLGMVTSGEQKRRIYLPDVRESTRAQFTLLSQGQAQDGKTLTWTPIRHWQVYLVHGSHHDLGYTDLPSNVLREHDRFMDEIVRCCEETTDWPEESQFRYVVEQGWSVLHYIEHRPPDMVYRLAHLMRKGRIEVTALLGNETSELCGHEEQIRLVYPSFRLKKRFGIPILTAELNDVPGLSWGLVSVLSGAGIRYFAPGIPDYFSWGFQVHPFWDEEAVLPRDMSGAFWWEGPDGSKILFWYGHGIDLWTYEQAENDLPQRLSELARRDYPFDLVRWKFQGGHRDNAPPDVRLSLIAREWNRRWAYPRLVVATNIRFFERFEREYGSHLRVLRGELPNTDYTVGATSTAKETGINRLTHDALLAAEKFAACAALVSDYEYPAEALREAYDSTLLYDEHTWGMAHPLGPAQDGCWSQKSQLAYRAAALTHDILVKSTNKIADEAHLVREGCHLLVFNPLTQERTDVVSVPAAPPDPCGRPMHWAYPAPGEGRPPVLVSGTAVGRGIMHLPPSLLEQPFELIDLSSGRSVPYQIVTLEDPLAARPLAAYRYALGGVDPTHLKELVFVAENVPPLGYKTYRIVPVAQPPSFESGLQTGEHLLESRFYRVTLDPQSARVASIYDKELQREWVDSSAPHGFNQLVARLPRTGETLAPERPIISQGADGPVFASLILKGDAPGCPQRTQEIILYDSLRRIDFANRLLKDATPLLELYFAFPFAIANPSFRYESSNSVIEPIRDQLPGSNTDSYAMQHWVAVWDASGGITFTSLEAPVMEVGGLWPGYVSQAHHGVTPPGYGHEFLKDPSQLERGHIYSCAMVSNFRTNFQPVQVADVLFRYSVTSHRGDWREGKACAFGWAASTPLVPVCIHGPREGSLPDSAFFCQIDQSNVLLLTMKGAEDGDGLILRLAETEGRDAEVTVTVPFWEIVQAFATNLVEENEGTLSYDRHSVRVPVRANGLATVRCRSPHRWPEARSLAHF